MFCPKIQFPYLILVLSYYLEFFVMIGIPNKLKNYYYLIRVKVSAHQLCWLLGLL